MNPSIPEMAQNRSEFGITGLGLGAWGCVQKSECVDLGAWIWAHHRAIFLGGIECVGLFCQGPDKCYDCIELEVVNQWN